MEKPGKSWKRMAFKSHKVWMASGTDGRPLTRNGKVLIKYQLDQDYEYWVHEKDLYPVDPLTPPPFPERIPKKVSAKGPGISVRHDSVQDIGVDCIVIFTDGASSGNPGPSGIGILLRHKGREKEISRFIGTTTNNVAELQAIHTALAELKTAVLPVRLFTDSTYAQGVLILGWKAKKNQVLIRSIKELMAKFKDLKIIHVKGHEGDEGNERANRLAVSAAKSRGK